MNATATEADNKNSLTKDDEVFVLRPTRYNISGYPNSKDDDIVLTPYGWVVVNGSTLYGPDGWEYDWKDAELCALPTAREAAERHLVERATYQPPDTEHCAVAGHPMLGDVAIDGDRKAWTVERLRSGMIHVFHAGCGLVITPDDWRANYYQHRRALNAGAS